MTAMRSQALNSATLCPYGNHALLAAVLMLTACQLPPALQQPHDLTVQLRYSNTDPDCPSERVSISVSRDNIKTLVWQETLTGTQTRTLELPQVRGSDSVALEPECVDMGGRSVTVSLSTKVAELEDGEVFYHERLANGNVSYGHFTPAPPVTLPQTHPSP